MFYVARVSNTDECACARDGLIVNLKIDVLSLFMMSYVPAKNNESV